MKLRSCILETKEGKVVQEYTAEGAFIPGTGDAIQVCVDDKYVEFYVHSRFIRQQPTLEAYDIILILVRRALQWLPTR